MFDFTGLSLDDLQVMVGYFVAYLHTNLNEVNEKTINGCMDYLNSHFEDIKKYVHGKGGSIKIELNNDKIVQLTLSDSQIHLTIKHHKCKIVKPNPYDSDVYNFLYECNLYQHLAYVDLYQIAQFFAKVLNLHITKEDTKTVLSIIIFMTQHFLEIAIYMIENKIVEIQLYKKKIMLQFVCLSRYPVYHRAFKALD